MPRTHRHHNPKDKAAALKRHLVDKVPVSQICEEMGGLQPSVFYSWSNVLFANADTVLSGSRPRPDKRESELAGKVAALEAKLARKDNVIAEITEEHVKSKKELGEP
ncbi:MAG: transposase [Dehalococcoidia bacterium]|nr:transposase [Dehalococcoidia bacterium]